MIVDLKGKDPDDAFSSIPYEKGYTFLSFLEKEVGKEKWNNFVHHYFTKFARRSLDSYDFKACLLAFFDSDSTTSAALSQVDFDAWFYLPGLPPKPDFDTSMVDVSYALASKWEGSGPEDFAPNARDIHGWSANQIVVFLDSVRDFSSPLTNHQTQSMDSAYGFANSGNVEVVARYFQIALTAKYHAVYKPTAELLSNIGRMKFVRPLYKMLSEADRSLAVETFEMNKDFYHPICRGLVEKDLFPKKDEA